MKSVGELVRFEKQEKFRIISKGNKETAYLGSITTFWATLKFQLRLDTMYQ